MAAAASDAARIEGGAAKPDVPDLPTAILLSKDAYYARVRLGFPAPLFQDFVRVFDADRERALRELSHRWSAVLDRVGRDVYDRVGDPTRVPLAVYLGREADLILLALGCPLPLFNDAVQKWHDEDGALRRLADYWTAMLRRLAPDTHDGTLRQFITTPSRELP